MFYEELKEKPLDELKAFLLLMDDSGNNPMNAVCMALCDRIAGLEAKIRKLEKAGPELLVPPVPEPGGTDDTDALREYVREAARIAARENTSGDFFNPMSWLDLELEDNPGRFDRFFQTPWHELSEEAREGRLMAIRRVL